MNCTCFKNCWVCRLRDIQFIWAVWGQIKFLLPLRGGKEKKEERGSVWEIHKTTHAVSSLHESFSLSPTPCLQHDRANKMTERKTMSAGTWNSKQWSIWHDPLVALLLVLMVTMKAIATVWKPAEQYFKKTHFLSEK